MSTRLSSERGAILIHVAVASIVLIAFSMFVIDYGVLWVSRGQAQNAADGGALAGAVALAFDDFDDRTADGPAKQAALRFALLNKVFGEDPDVQVDSDIIFYNDDPTKFPDECADDSCIRVDVYRNQARANPLPMWFGQLVGLNEQGVRATATAQIAAGNAAQCVKPWVVADRWKENEPNDPPWTQMSPFNFAGDPEPDPDDGVFDDYIPSTFDANGNFTSGTGFGKTDGVGGPLMDYGYQFILRMFNPGGGGTLSIRSPGWVMTVQLPNDEAGGGQDEVGLNISDCTDATVAIAAPDDPCTEPSPMVPNENGQIILTCLQVQTGNALNPQMLALDEWIGEEDADDRWLDFNEGSCTNEKGCPSNTSSRRIIPLALFDPEHYAASGANGTNGVVKVVNILGFFVEGTCASGGFDLEPYLLCSESGPGEDLVGRLVTIPGDMIGGLGNLGPASFTQVIRLIR